MTASGHALYFYSIREFASRYASQTSTPCVIHTKDLMSASIGRVRQLAGMLTTMLFYAGWYY